MLCDRIDLLREHGQLTVRGQAIKAVTLIPELYGRTGHGLVWRDETKILALITAVEDSRLDGLIPADYHHETLAAMLRDYRAGLMSACERADFDILLTDALVRLGYHYLFGKVNPKNLDEDWNLSRDIDGRDPVDITLSIINGESLQQGLATLIPDTDIYLKMKRALATYRAIAARGGWPALPAGPTLRPGMQSDRLTAIRNRLQITGDLASGPSEDPSNYDVTLLEAVRHFQRRHMLEPDGIIGEKTREAMNVPVAARVDQIRVNMERARWVFRHVPEEYLITDIAGFRVLYIRHGQIVWTAPAQVGRPFRKTPVFQDTLKYLVFNPTWTVPPTILKNDVLPMIQHDPGYLEKEHAGDRRQQLDSRPIDHRLGASHRGKLSLSDPPGTRSGKRPWTSQVHVSQ